MLAALWATGIYLFLLPQIRKARGSRAAEA
jgi:hypothetical protein